MSWFPRVQTCVAISFAETGYVDLSDVVKDSEFIRRILKFIELHHATRTVVHEDDQGTILLATKLQSSSGSRHIDMRHQ